MLLFSILLCVCVFVYVCICRVSYCVPVCCMCESLCLVYIIGMYVQGRRQHVKVGGGGGGGGAAEVYVIFEDRYLSKLKKSGESL